MVTGPTHIAGHTLDLIFTDATNLVVDTPAVQVWTDHLSVDFHLDIQTHKEPSIRALNPRDPGGR